MCPHRRPEMIEALRKLLAEGFEGNQEEICKTLAAQGFDVNQSTISRALRRVGAVKSMAGGGVGYKLGDARGATLPGSVRDLVLSIDSNESMIVIKTAPGSAPFVCDFLDHAALKSILGILAGDDTAFVAPRHARDMAMTLEELRKAIRGD